ncbi:hypothetical protein PSN13_02914 [Micromonospora saelicesensis]|uniref:DUF4232 domain-containing protein n=1 Tax=Micromonospora saelicesensis TaxID=285676 RepID=A0A328NL23_9ACTN|nr:hypothetical protein [Micromonospora saelicesensis]RAO34047.1 hypothetical protein PSN13_02914 [Micromonospora saelicesensis]
MRRLLVPLLIVLTVVAACAGPNAQPGRSDPTVAEPAPTELLADGSVPWADLKITGEDLNGRPAAPRTPAAGSETCRAEQLTGRLTTWTRPGTGGETPRGFDATIGKLIGEVDVRNSSTVECTLQGEVPTTMLAGGREIPMLYTHGIDEEGRTRVVAVPAGGHASLRLDWSGPFCQPVKGALELAIELPHDGGRLRAPVAADERPGCPQGEGVHPRARGTLSASGFTEPVTVSKPPPSPLEKLSVAVQGPATAVAGSRLTFRVTLGNPTDGPLALDPCPGYLMERYSLGDATNDAVNAAQLYRLNCRALPQIPAGGSAVFEMVAEVPASMRAGRELSVTWKLYLPHYVQRANQFGVLTLTVV